MKTIFRSFLVAALLVPTFLVSSCKDSEDTKTADPGFVTSNCVLASDSSDDGTITVTSNASNQITGYAGQGINANLTYAGDSAYYAVSLDGNALKEVFFKDGTNWKKSIQRISGTTDLGGIQAQFVSTITTTPTYVSGKIASITSVTESKLTALGQTIPTPSTTASTTFTYNSDGNVSKYVVVGDSASEGTYNITYGTTAISSANFALSENVVSDGFGSIMLPLALGYYSPFTKMPATLTNGSGTLTFSNGVVDANKNVIRYNVAGTGDYSSYKGAVKSTFKCK